MVPACARSIALKHLDEGLIDRGITRDLAWGVPVTRGGQPRTGLRGQGLLRLVRRAHRIHRARRRSGPTRAAATGGAWWRTDEGAGDVRYVEFMGKDNVAFHTVSFPATILGSGEPWKTVDVLKAFNWLNWYGGKFSTSQKRGVVHGRGAGDSAAGLLALVPDRQQPGTLRHHLHLGAASGLGGEPRPGRRAGQFRQPHPEVLRDPVRGRRAGRRRAWAAGGGAATPTSPRSSPSSPSSSRPSRCASPPRRCARCGCWATSICRRPRPGRRSRPIRDRAAVVVRTALNLVALFARVSRAGHPVRRRGDRRGGGRALAADLAVAGRRGGAWPPGAGPQGYARRRCCSGRSRRPRWPNGRSGSAAAEA